jgi:hypothetical protein
VKVWRVVAIGLLGLALTSCLQTGATRPVPPVIDPETKGFPTPPPNAVRENVYGPMGRTTAAPAGYGLYTSLITRSANRNSVRTLAALFASTVGAGEAAMARENLNLIMIPVTDEAQARVALASAREQAEATAAALMQKHYDFGQAMKLRDIVCRPERSSAVQKVCASTASDGPWLVTAQRPLTAADAAAQPLLIVDLSVTPPAAVAEVLATYRQQIVRGRGGENWELGWRLRFLNSVLEAADFLPLISKVYAASK